MFVKKRSSSPAETIMNLSIPEPNSGCWLWIGSLSDDGYARVRGTTGHKLSYLTFNGPVPDGCELDHKCRVRCCVNPDHLQAITHIENVRRGDYKRNHRNARKTHCKRGHPLSGNNLILQPNGTRHCRSCKNLRRREESLKRNPRLASLLPGQHPNAKFSEEAIVYMRTAYPRENLSQLARRFKAHPSTISKIVKNTHYRYLLTDDPV